MKCTECLCIHSVYMFEIETARLEAAVCKELCALRTKGKRRGAYSAPLSLPLDLDVHEHHRARRHSPLSSTYG
jgi:hypothetical protein